MYKFTLTSSSPNNTISIAKHLASCLNNTDIVVLTGELGARKN